MAGAVIADAPDGLEESKDFLIRVTPSPCPAVESWRSAVGGACAAKSSIYCANIAADLMLAQFARWLRGLPTVADLRFNIMASEVDCFG